MQGQGEAPAGTDTKAAAPWSLHGRGCLEESCEPTSSQELGGGHLAGRDPRDWWVETRRHQLKSKPGTGAVGQRCSPGEKPGLHEGSCSRDNLISLQISVGAVIAKICVCLGAEPRTGRSARRNKSSLGYFTAVGSNARSPRLFKTLPEKALRLLLLSC